MKDRYNDIEELIGKHLAGEASQDESALVEAWRNENAANQKYFEQYQTIFNRAATVKVHEHFDTDAAWNKVKGKLHEKKSAKLVNMRGDVSISKQFLRIAASLVFIIGIGFFAYRIAFPERDKIEVASTNTVVTDTLPDGSNIVLNKQSRIAYSFNPRKKEHVVKIQGEAYFTINSKEDKTFIVEAEGLLIRDIGTSFNVKAYPNSDTVEIYVQEGEVLIEREDGNPDIHLKAEETVRYVKSAKLFLPTKSKRNTVAYKTKFFEFADTDLRSVIESLNDVYEEKIVISDNLKNCRLTVTFSDENIEEIANIIAETLALKVVKTDGQIKLEGDGCE